MTPELPTQALPDALSELLDLIEAELHGHIYFTSPHHAPTLALYAAYTHVAYEFDVAPYLFVFSPLLRCGKTRVLTIMRAFVANPLPTANISVAALYRIIEMRRPTLLFDEVDLVFSRRSSDPLAGDLQRVLNAGFLKGNPIIRMGGPGYRDPEEHDAFGPKVLAGIGKVPSTVADRSIPIRMHRKPPHIEKRRFSFSRDLPRLTEYRDQLSTILTKEDSLRKVRAAEPPLLDVLNDRAQDLWEPILAVAEMAGGSWPKKARACAEGLHTAGEESEGSLGLQLLEDMRRVWIEGRTAMTTQELLRRLHELGEAPWQVLRGKRLSDRDLALLLKPFGISSSNRRIEGMPQAKGYAVRDFEPIWSQFVSEETASASQPSQPSRETLPSTNGRPSGTVQPNVIDAPIIDLLRGQIRKA